MTKTVFGYNSCFWQDLFDCASTTAPQYGLGSVPKASDLDFMLLTNLKKIGARRTGERAGNRASGREGERADLRTGGRTGGRTGRRAIKVVKCAL